MTNENDAEEVVAEMVADGDRRIRVYDRKGDFFLDVPDGSKITFGYFNPSVVNEGRRHDYTTENVAKQTALRVYERGEKGNQLACFIGVLGFRDLSLRLTRLTQRIVVERTFAADDEGEQWSGRRQRELRAAPEEDVFE